MIDGIKTGYLPLDAGKLSERLGMTLNSRRDCHNCNGLIFDFVELVDSDTGELRYMCKLRGSVHKYANRGAHNADAFRMSDLCRTFILLQQEYGIKPGATPLLNVEFGVNLKLSYSPQQVIKAVRLYKGFRLVPMSNIGVEYKADAFRIKIYDKGKQCKLHEFENVLRVEVKVEQYYLKKRGVRVPMLGDLLNTDVWRQFENILLDIVKNITFAEAIPSEGLTKKEGDLLELFAGDGWQALDKFKRYRERKKYQALVERLNTICIKEYLKSLIESECKRLRDIEFRYLDGVLFAEDSDAKVNKCDKMICGRGEKTATSTANSEDVKKWQNRYLGGTWITSVSVAETLTTDTMPSIDKERCISSAKISDMKIGEVKSRGKPPDILGIDGS